VVLYSGVHYSVVCGECCMSCNINISILVEYAWE
jgi:hypothetical protein